MTRAGARAALGHAAILAGVLGPLAYVLTLLPVAADGWDLVIRLRERPLSPGSVLDYARYGHFELNPRIGEVFDYLAHAGTALHVGMTLGFVSATLLAMFVLAHGAWPSASQPRDAWRLLVLVGVFCLGVPSIGQLLCYRPYTTNYVYGFAFPLWLAVPYRLAWSTPAGARGAAAAALAAAGMLVLGVLAGMSNEHTGAPVLLALATLTALVWRRDRRLPAWMPGGLVGLAAGIVLLLGAPGQTQRYQGLALEQSLVGRVLERGLAGNAERLGLFLAVTSVTLLVVGVAALGARRRPPAERAWRPRAAFLVGVAWIIALTLLASPKQGLRLYYAPALLVAIAAAMALDAHARGRVARAAIALVAASAWLFCAARLVGIYRTGAREADARLALLAAAPPGSIAVVPPYSHFAPSWFAIGDDFRLAHVRQRMARRLYGLDNARLDLDDPARLGASGLALSLEQRSQPPLPAATVAAIDGDGFSGLVFAAPGLERTLALYRRAVDALAGQPGHRLAHAALRVEAVAPAALRGRPLYLASWDGALRLPRALARGQLELAVPAESWREPESYLLLVGDQARPVTPARAGGRATLRLEPWRTGGYLVIACDDAACHVIATALG